jgi:hypothetical protein
MEIIKPLAVRRLADSKAFSLSINHLRINPNIVRILIISLPAPREIES